VEAVRLATLDVLTVLLDRALVIRQLEKVP